MDLLISIVSYKTLKRSLNLAENLLKKINNEINFQIIILENSYHRANQYRFMHSYIKVYYSTNNIGYAAGHNLVISRNINKLSEDGRILILNPDIEIKDLKINKFLKTTKNLKLDGCSPVQLISDKKSYPKKTLLGKTLIQTKKVKEMKFKTDRLDGAFMMITKKAILKTGLLPEFYFLYFEELHYSYLLRKNGFKLYYLPEFTYSHKGTHILSQTRSYLMGKNLFIFSLLNFKFISIIYIFKTFPRSLFKYVLFNKYKYSYLKGISKGIFLYIIIASQDLREFFNNLFLKHNK